MTTDPIELRSALVSTVRSSLESLAFLDAEPTQATGSTVSAELSQWSWVKITEPSPGMVVLAMTAELLNQIGCSMVGEMLPLGSAKLGDCQAELTNILAGSLMRAVAGPLANIGIGLPRTGRGAPNVKDKGWLAQEFTVAGQHMAVFVQGEVLQLAVQVEVVKLPLPPKSQHTPPSSATDVTIVGFDPSADAVFAPANTPVQAIPETLAGYRILEHLGDGGMGVIYKARHETLDRLAAIKVMRPEFAQNERFVARFLREARIAARIDHPNVVTVHDAGVQDGHLFIAMRFVSGGDLAKSLRLRGTYSQQEALLLVARCLLGLKAISDAGLVHRDIKPANILIETDGSPRLADLGLARAVERNSQFTNVGSVQGTPAYMAPEQARGNLDLDVRCDIYALGATLYTLLAGHPPFSGGSAYETIARVLTQEPPSLLTRQPAIVPAVYPEVDSLVMRAMAKDPAKRPQTPEYFMDEIASILLKIGGSQSVSNSDQAPTSDTSGTTAPRSEVRAPSGPHWLARLMNRWGNG